MKFLTTWIVFPIIVIIDAAATTDYNKERFLSRSNKAGKRANKAGNCAVSANKGLGELSAAFYPHDTCRPFPDILSLFESDDDDGDYFGQDDDTMDPFPSDLDLIFFLFAQCDATGGTVIGPYFGDGFFGFIVTILMNLEFGSFQCCSNCAFDMHVVEKECFPFVESDACTGTYGMATFGGIVNDDSVPYCCPTGSLEALGMDWVEHRRTLMENGSSRVRKAVEKFVIHHVPGISTDGTAN